MTYSQDNELEAEQQKTFIHTVETMLRALNIMHERGYHDNNYMSLHRRFGWYVTNHSNYLTPTLVAEIFKRFVQYHQNGTSVAQHWIKESLGLDISEIPRVATSESGPAYFDWTVQSDDYLHYSDTDGNPYRQLAPYFRLTADIENLDMSTADTDISAIICTTAATEIDKVLIKSSIQTVINAITFRSQLIMEPDYQTQSPQMIRECIALVRRLGWYINHWNSVTPVTELMSDAEMISVLKVFRDYYYYCNFIADWLENVFGVRKYLYGTRGPIAYSQRMRYIARAYPFESRSTDIEHISIESLESYLRRELDQYWGEFMGLVDTTVPQPIGDVMITLISSGLERFFASRVEQEVIPVNYEQFAFVLGVTGGVISGSFLLSCVYGITYSTEIDIFIQYHSSAQITDTVEMVCASMNCRVYREKPNFDDYPDEDSENDEDEDEDDYDDDTDYDDDSDNSDNNDNVQHVVESTGDSEPNLFVRLGQGLNFFVRRVVTLSNGVQLVFVDLSNCPEDDGDGVPAMVRRLRQTCELNLSSTCMTDGAFFVSKDGLPDLVTRQTCINSSRMDATSCVGKVLQQISKYERAGVYIVNKTRYIESLTPCLICTENQNDSTGDLNCGHSIHSQCLTTWSQYSPGDFVTENKYRCPVCRAGKIPQQLIARPRIDLQSLNLTLYRYRICVCLRAFEAGPISCTANLDELPTRCHRCVRGMRVFRCPNCGLGLQRESGCSTFRCCRHGNDSCRGELCDHGSTNSVKFCGHQWVIHSTDADMTTTLDSEATTVVAPAVADTDRPADAAESDDDWVTESETDAPSSVVASTQVVVRGDQALPAATLSGSMLSPDAPVPPSVADDSMVIENASAIVSSDQTSQQHAVSLYQDHVQLLLHQRLQQPLVQESHNISTVVVHQSLFQLLLAQRRRQRQRNNNN